VDQPRQILETFGTARALYKRLYLDHKMKLYLDDERFTPEGWIQVRWPEEAIEILKTEKNYRT